MNALKKLFGGNTRQFGMIFALVALVIFFQIFTSGRTLTPGNVINLFNGNSYILILAIGMVLVIIAGHIDLSVGSVAAFVGISVALAIRDWHLPGTQLSCSVSCSACSSVPGKDSGRHTSAYQRSS